MAVYRNDATLARIRLQFVMLASVGLGVGALGLIRMAGGRAGGGYSVWASASLAAIGVVGLFLVRRVSRVAVETGDEGITVRNVATTRHLPWSKIERFEQLGSRRGVTQAVVRTSAAKVHTLTACGDPGPTCAKILEKLARELARARGG